MDAMTTNAQRLSVAPYRVNRDAFLPKYPMFTILTRFYGVISSQLDTTWDTLASPDYALWDAGAASTIWISVPNGMYNQLVSGDSAAIVVDHQLHGDRTSTRLYSAAVLQPSWDFSSILQQSTRSWAIVALRVMGTDLNGPLLSLGVGGQTILVSSMADVFDMKIDTISFATHTKAKNDSRVTLVGIAVNNDTVTIAIRDGERTGLYKWVTAQQLVANQMIVGGASSPECLLYAVAQGNGTNMLPVMRQMAGYISC